MAVNRPVQPWVRAFLFFLDSSSGGWPLLVAPPPWGGLGGGGCVPPSHSSSHISILLEIMNDNLINITKFPYSHPRVAHIADTGSINLL